MQARIAIVLTLTGWDVAVSERENSQAKDRALSRILLPDCQREDHDHQIGVSIYLEMYLKLLVIAKAEIVFGPVVLPLRKWIPWFFAGSTMTSVLASTCLRWAL